MFVTRVLFNRRVFCSDYRSSSCSQIGLPLRGEDHFNDCAEMQCGENSSLSVS